MIEHRGWFAAFLFTTAFLIVMAGVHGRAKGADVALPCSVIAALVQQAGGLDAAIKQAKARGYSEHQIQSVIRECGLK